MWIRPERRTAWFIVFLLSLLYFINFLDKAIIGLSAVHIMKEMNLTPTEFGLVNSVFFLFFVPLQLVGGLLADRYQSRWILLVMALSWSAAMMPILLPAGFAVLLASR
ncbi:MAG TPA: MFS transporter, partial [Sphingomonadaceae bacterium]|nr:MFS transporter [Sphingomonadaceae bacterium]